MRDAFEKFAQMEWVTWLSVMCVALSATVVRLLVEATELTVRGFLIGSVLAGFLAYLTALYCVANGISGQMMGVIVGFVTYQATNILTGIGKLGAAFAKDPLALLDKIRKAGRK